MRMYVRRHAVALVIVVAVLAACVLVNSTSIRVAPVTRARIRVDINSPVRAHLSSGEVVIFRNGASVVGDSIVVGDGRRYDVLREKATPVGSVRLADVIGLESIELKYNMGRSLLYSIPTFAGSVIFDAALAVVIFGSCPTIYADSAGTPALQAESFSYSIAPLLAKRDVDRLNVGVDSTGNVRLEVRNEALETHYIDQLELLEARHRRDEFLLPAARSGLIAVRDVVPVHDVHDSKSRDVTRLIDREDGIAFASDEKLLVDGAEGRAAPDDYLDIVVPRPRGGDSLALVLKMRSSLLSTTIFYEHMLARAGARSLDWVGNDLSRITSVAAVARWYTDNFGLRVLVRDGDDWRPVVRLMDFGPAAWRNVAAVVRDVGTEDSVHLRLAFTTDEWRIDRIAVAWEMRVVEPRRVPVARISSAPGESRADAQRYLAKADDQYLVTEPGSRFYADFHVGVDTSVARTFLLAADGYYTEWVRPAWIRAARDDAAPFSARTTKREILASWLASKDSLERRFFRDRVPVP